MARADITLEQASHQDLAVVERLLAANDLPTADVRSTPATFYLARDETGETVGAGAVRIEGQVGLLRSVVVDEPHRRRGYGTQLVRALESTAAASGVAELYLLTTTASAFFATKGYEVVDRERAPRAIKRTRQFDTLCPSTATCMRNRLDGTGDDRTGDDRTGDDRTGDDRTGDDRTDRTADR